MKASDRVGQLRQRIGEIGEAEKYAHSAGALESARGELETHRRALESLVRTARVLVKNRSLDPSSLPTAKKLEDFLKKTTEAFAQEPTSITKGRTFTALGGYLDETIKKLTDVLKEAWRQEVATAPKTNDALLNKIALLRGKATVVRQLRNAAANLAEASKRLPADEDEWLNYQTLRKLVEEQVRALGTTQFPKAALDFCIAAQSDGADLSALTDEVRLWLEEQGLLSDLRYRFR
jgi:hypothetical protein